MLNKHILLLACISTSLFSFPDKPLDQNTLPAYTDLYINSLFGTRREQRGYNKDFINDIIRKAESSAKNNCPEYGWFFSTGKFKRDCVEHAIRTTVVDAVAQEAYALAYEFTHHPATLAYIKEAINNEVLKIFTESKNLNGSLNGYMGEQLKQKVWQLKNKFDQEQRSAQKVHYPSDACCSCLEAFDGASSPNFPRPVRS